MYFVNVISETSGGSLHLSEDLGLVGSKSKPIDELTDFKIIYIDTIYRN